LQADVFRLALLCQGERVMQDRFRVFSNIDRTQDAVQLPVYARVDPRTYREHWTNWTRGGAINSFGIGAQHQFADATTAMRAQNYQIGGVLVK
jgi:hypothetical protein